MQAGGTPMQGIGTEKPKSTKITFHEQLDGLISTAIFTYGTLSRIEGYLLGSSGEDGKAELPNDSLQGKIDTLRRIMNDTSRQADLLEGQIGYHPTPPQVGR